MNKMTNKNLSIVTWKEIREDVLNANPTLCAQIDKLNPSDNYKLVKARYFYGDFVLKNGALCLPTDNGVRELTDDQLPQEYRNLLSYSYIPMGITLNHSLELFLNVSDTSFSPFGIMYPGKLFALWTILEVAASAHSGKIWSISAGARSIFLLPKITESGAFWRLKKEFGINEDIPQNFTDQWLVFKELAKNTNDPWHVDVLFFSQSWLDKQDGAWQGFRKYLLEESWHSTAFLRNKIIFDLILSSALANKKIKSDSYLTDTVKHLHAIGSGFYPGFVIANDNECAPISMIQKIFTNIYGLKYAPTLTHLDYMHRNDKPCYYSLQHPTLIDSSQKSSIQGTNIKDLEVIDTIMQTLLDYILEERPDLHHGPIFEWARTIRHTYIHHKPDIYKNVIIPTSNLPNRDPTLKAELKRHKKLKFCDSNSFMRGCIQLLTSDFK